MKKLYSALSIIIISTSFIFAREYKPVLHIQPSVRQQGFGGFYTTDVKDFYGLYANPATLGLNVPHSLFPSLDLHLAGPLADIPRFVRSLENNDTSVISDIIEKENGFRLSMDLQPFLSFGHISSFGFGWGISTQPFMKVEIPGITSSDFNVGLETVFTAGYGFSPLNTDNHRLSIGVTTKGFFQIAGVMNDGILDVVDTLSDGNLKNIPAYVTTGFSFDAGIFYSLCNMLDVALVVYDPWSLVLSSKSTLGDIFKFNFKKTDGFDPRIAAGLCYHIYTDWSRGKISELNIRADYRNFMVLFDDLSRNPILELSAGIEAVFVDIISLRFGISEMYPCAGVGLKFSNFNIDFAIYGKELGLEPGSCPCLNSSIFIGFKF
ncbi:MAG: hypothetical protein IK002_01110 [Treponema sp.]|uniref:hypothetical protein n=1 Tax=Treponema sp. TaxID=166 RepID=UPI00298D7529|nr:hypothetical protein [Treponema sp.]MBR5932563.1 hypothetical protein [Treponema sp.]